MIRILASILRWLLARLYKIEVAGRHHLDDLDENVLVVANHTSFLDALLLYLFLPFPVTFAINTHQSRQWYVRAFRDVVRLFPLDPANPLSIRTLIQQLQQGERVVIFPEGRITVTGALMKVYNGPGLVAVKSGAQVLPVAINGAQYTTFSRLKNKVRLRWFPKITLTIMAPRRIEPPQNLRGRDQREYAGKRLSDLMVEMVFQADAANHNLFKSLLDARNIHGGSHGVVEDPQKTRLSYNDLLLRIILLGRWFKTRTGRGDKVGVLLPNMNGAVVTFWALVAQDRVPAMLNFTAGAKGMVSACETAGLKTVVTSRQFIRRADLDEAVAALADKVEILYLEDLAKDIARADKLKAWIASRLEALINSQVDCQTDPDAAAVVLFTSGSEGVPKGVVLSHRNLLANIRQLTTRFDFNAHDVLLNAMPMFHAFGLTGGTLLPILSGMRTVLYPSPLHYRVIPELAYDTGATILFGTNTFLAGYAKAAHPYDFYSVRYVFAGAERLKPETRELWQQKFGVRIFEGYGATECSPVVAGNTPMDYRPGSVGRLMPGMAYQLEAVAGLEQGGRLHVRGPNVMAGYLLHDRPGELVAPQSVFGPGWYDTGDIVTIDADGFIYIQGRVKRFAKVAGEMISLSVAENLAAKLWPDEQHAAIAVDDPGKGEKVVLLTERPGADRSALLEQARREGVGELALPRQVITVSQIPLLGIGKIDYLRAAALAEDRLAAHRD
ncbi:acyl-[ACP]--phospholipid O-acyltransferase [Candidatus Tenderia electrophaga]|jgi:acyl-[acyl-carrier-protein]-phospholipid O-acyltransferase/long-chain-fatty-acid--[acyl-carrier-protein] ligase|uniref:Acyl-[ACP]--phospholipid O-acyltransferase n=1 Tax=Candidatus Tenderia electrophaga TaxID=1748243 RepID=A0A0S2TCV5_9GAMM|nr:acyl-[ACP]--phospholipid O-acyltransferase [Candidatus Tenderia electrophaga]